MPYDFHENRAYNIDYDLLRKFIRERNIFKNKSNENIYRILDKVIEEF